MLRSVIPLLIVSAFMGCSAPSVERPDTRAEEDAVYTALLNDRHHRAGMEFVIIRGETVNGLLPMPLLDSVSEGQLRFIREHVPSVSPSTLSDFVVVNREPRLLSEVHGFTTAHQILHGHDLEALKRNPGEAATRFVHRYPNPLGLVSLSRVGFNFEQTQALVYAQYWCGGDCGHGEYVLLERTDGKWQVREDATAFVS